MSKINDDLHVGGLLTADQMQVASGSISNDGVAANADIARSKLAQDTLAKYAIPLTSFRVHDAMQTNLPGTSANDDLALIGGTFGTNSPEIKTSDLKAAGATTRYARALIQLPPEYDDAQTVEIRVKGGMETTVADTSATVDVECYESDKSGGVGSDLCTTAAQSINSLTAADKDFTITASGLVAGDILDVRITVAVNDAASGTAVVAALGAIELLCDIRG